MGTYSCGNSFVVYAINYHRSQIFHKWFPGYQTRFSNSAWVKIRYYGKIDHWQMAYHRPQPLISQIESFLSPQNTRFYLENQIMSVKRKGKKIFRNFFFWWFLVFCEKRKRGKENHRQELQFCPCNPNRVFLILLVVFLHLLLSTFSMASVESK